MNQQLIEMGQRAQEAANELAIVSTEQKNNALNQMADALLKASDQILAANQEDMDTATEMPDKFRDRLLLTKERIQQMADELRHVAMLQDPTTKIDRGWINKDGLQIIQQRVPLGVIGIIYEARPNVTSGASALTFKSGNAVILRGGKESLRTNEAVVKVLRQSLAAAGMPVDAIQLVKDTSHEVAQELMELNRYIDVIIPRGSQRLIQAVVKHATVPVIETGAGNCHLYVDKDADLQKATPIIINAKVQRPSVCNAAEKLLVHKDVAADYLPVIIAALRSHGVEVRGDERVRKNVSDVKPASAVDWDTEYNDLIMAVKVVDSMDEAIKHINLHGTHHSESIITENGARGREFQQRINSAVVYVNASTRFTDGGEFGFGAEIGISTQKLHARGPMGLDQLTTIKYEVTGNGQVRK
ncbi:glutamate-5-semialdehyde dehydrogenase [Limosilactobacillus secaliphilus]|uniref:Gamma-glutamyl phosphate reductase n=1 Tax=Limosilactobacillus secaliphilus TaxID=396268 RepID=A0A0R2ICK7_9LACO|nr:glutamate-5-semialdehyde dehydrogenase [Limosilactobacillus secaliphilus]KRN59309.1 gamma-glutamyl phosphate reductase [Limosilactobacillus secaliphilus]